MGSLVGALFAVGTNLLMGAAVVDITSASLVGMAALAAAIVGAPMTMAMLILEGTHDFVLASAVMAAVLVANTVVRQVFGYSFSTWRLHLRGENIRSARDVGWVRHLSAGKMMRKDANHTRDDTSVSEFRRRFPLGSTQRVVLEDALGRYAGVVPLAILYGDRVREDAPVSDYAQHRDAALLADTDIVAVMKVFDATQADELAVIDQQRTVLGVLSGLRAQAVCRRAGETRARVDGRARDWRGVSVRWPRGRGPRGAWNATREALRAALSERVPACQRASSPPLRFASYRPGAARSSSAPRHAASTAAHPASASGR